MGCFSECFMFITFEALKLKTSIASVNQCLYEEILGKAFCVHKLSFVPQTLNC